jgi:hypothetical protein
VDVNLLRYLVKSEIVTVGTMPWKKFLSIR